MADQDDTPPTPDRLREEIEQAIQATSGMGLTVRSAADAALTAVRPHLDALTTRQDQLTDRVRRLAERNRLGHQGLKDTEEEAFRQRRRADQAEALLAEVGKIHIPHECPADVDACPCGGETVCAGCRESYPCRTRRVLDRHTARRPQPGVLVTMEELAELLAYVTGADSINVVQKTTLDRLFTALRSALEQKPAKPPDDAG